MKACILVSPAPVESNPLRIVELPKPKPAAGQVLVRVHACGGCRTDLHVVEGELPPRKSPIVPGHQVVGVVEENGPHASRFQPGARVGIPWLHQTCGACEYCRAARENLCERAVFTGWMVDGGYAEYVVAPEDFVYALPKGASDLHVAPLLCAGIIGYRCLRLTGVVGAEAAGGAVRGAHAAPVRRLGLYGFGAAAHIAVQVAAHAGWEVFVFTRGAEHRALARELGAAWAGETADAPGGDAGIKLDAAIVFAPAGELALDALRALDRGGTVALGGIHSSPIPPIDYPLIYHERVLRSVANSTREDARELLAMTAETPIVTDVRVFELEQANDALLELKERRIRGAAVLRID